MAVLIGFIMSSCNNGTKVETDNSEGQEELEQLDEINNELDDIQSESDSLDQLLNEIEEL